MSIETYIHRAPHGEGIRLAEDSWYSARFGLFNSRDEGSIDSDKVGELEEKARELEYDSLSLGPLEKFASRFYGGSIETPYGQIEWLGTPDRQVQEFVDEIRKAIDR